MYAKDVVKLEKMNKRGKMEPVGKRYISFLINSYRFDERHKAILMELLV